MTSRTEEMSQTRNKNELTIVRVFDAPREAVWKAWTDPERAKRWWGPEGFTAPSIKIDLRVGGKYLFCMRSPDGKDFLEHRCLPGDRPVATDCLHRQLR